MNLSSAKCSFIFAIFLFLTTNVFAQGLGNVNDERVINSPDIEPGSWLTYGQSFKEQRFSQLTQINTDTVARLGLAWTKQIGDYNMRMQGTPLVIDGVMYVLFMHWMR